MSMKRCQGCDNHIPGGFTWEGTEVLHPVYCTSEAEVQELIDEGWPLTYHVYPKGTP